ncbi:hypothetical protein RHMOL_Rhmol10G0068700 [Rhododendron molle]|uniref:Uncharacterized protein n=1 Tax=Rhododendron molle TaxID=49168 RepID=A0ACC0M0Q7_RHOML|nr:hypothetical protein RHMOL_Rhmol10G0068700 [Rhododendron molle]
MRPFLFTEIVAGGGESEVYDNLLANGAFYTADMGLILLSRRKLTSCPLDDRLLRVEVEYGSASSCSIRDAQVAVPPDIYALTNWLFDVPPTSPTAEELEEKWLELQNLMKCKGKESSSTESQRFLQLCINGAQITGIKGNCWRLLIRYKQSSLDYRGIMLDLMRNFIHAVTLPTAMKKKPRDDFDKILIEFEDDAEFKKVLKEFEKDDSKHVSITTISDILRKTY